MNEDSGGVADSTAYRLSAKEEAALLAEYGTEGLFDDGIGWAEPSHFKSKLGDGDVFLTRAAADEENDDEEKNSRGEKGGGWRNEHDSLERRPAYTDPLSLYLLRHAPTLILPTRTTPASLAQPISSLVTSLEEASKARGKRISFAPAVEVSSTKLDTESRFAPVLRSGKEWERRATLAVQGIPTTAFVSYLLSPEADSSEVAPASLSSSSPLSTNNDYPEEDEAEFNKLIGTTTNMLRDADHLLDSLTRPADPAQEEAVAQHDIEELQRREALAMEDFVDQYWEKEAVLNEEDDDAITRELLQRSRESSQRLRVALMVSAATAADDGRDGNGDQNTINALDSASSANANIKQESPSAPLTKKETLEDAEKSIALLPPPSLLPPADDAEYLYAFEMELPKAETVLYSAEAFTAINDATVNEKPQRSAVETPFTEPKKMTATPIPPSTPQDATTVAGEPQQQEASITQLILRSSAILQAIVTAEQRDTQVLQQGMVNADSPSFRHRIGHQQNEPGTHITKKSNRDALGLVVLPSFAERLDMLFMPTHDEQEERTRRRNSAAETNNSPNYENGEVSLQKDPKTGKTGGAATARSSTAPSLEQIRRQAAIESFLLLQQTEEGRRMRQEDEVVARKAHAAEELVRFYTDRIAAVQDDALRGANALFDEEAIAFKEMNTAQAKDAALARQVEQLRQIQQVEALAYTLMMEWEVHRERLLQDEALTFRKLARAAEEARVQAVASTEKRKSAEAAAAYAYLIVLQKAFEERRAVLVKHHAASSIRSSKKTSTELQCTVWYRWRVQPLQQECARIHEWAVAQHKQIENLRDLVTEAESRYRRHIVAAIPPKDRLQSTGRAIRVPEVPITKNGNNATYAGASTLTLEKLLHLLWPAFRAAVLEPRQAAQYLARWCLSLEDIDAVEWPELQSLELLEGAESQKLCVAATHFVKDVDLSGNPLKRIDVLQAVHTFPLLQRLTLSNAQLQKLDSPDPMQASQLRANGRYSSPSPLDEVRVSSGSSSAHLRHISAARNHALAEQVHLLEIDASSNQLTSLVPLGVVATSSLTRCAVVDNQLASLDAVAACAWLRVITVAHNKLQSVLCLQGLRLLRELDVGNNDLCQLDEDAASANPVPLWSKLFVSHNRLKTLPSSFHGVYPCLSQLFINHNDLTVLDAESMAWFPLLRVLQAEGNKLADISGLQHCTRLESVKLSHNLLSTVDALLPLASCRRLTVLDLSGNPLFVEGDSKEAQQAGRLVCGMLLWLEELNNTPVRCSKDYRRSGSNSVSSPRDAEKNATGTQDAAHMVWEACTGRPHAVSWECDVCHLVPNLSCPTDWYSEVSAALCWDAMLRHTQDERERQEALIARKLNRAKGWEATVTTARERAATTQRSDSGNAVFTAIYGITAAQRDTRRAEYEAEVSLFKLDRTTLSTWITVADKCAAHAQPPSLETRAVLYSNRYETYSTYRQQEEDHLQKLARAYMAEWLYSRVVVRRAKRELQALQAAHRESEAFSREAAARRIQPVWRGAALRSRLQRLLHSNDSAEAGLDDVDDDTFAKVNVNDWLTEDASSLTPVELLLHTVVDAVRDVAAVPFDVPQQPVAVPSGVKSTVPPSSSALAPLLPVSEPSRVHTGEAVDHASPRLPQIRADSGPSAKVAGTLEEQWGPEVAAQIRKKQQKNSRASNERRRKEFLQDPLRVQQEMRDAHARHRLK